MAGHDAMDYNVQQPEQFEQYPYHRSHSMSSQPSAKNRQAMQEAKLKEVTFDESMYSAVHGAIQPLVEKIDGIDKCIEGAVSRAMKQSVDKFEDIDTQLQNLVQSSIKLKASKKDIFQQQIDLLAKQKSESDQAAEYYKQQFSKIQNELSRCKAEIQSEQSDPYGQSNDLLSWFFSWLKTTKSDHNNVKYLKQENSELKAKIKELENTVAQKDSMIERLRGKTMDFLEKSEAVVDISKNENHIILEDFKKFMDKKLSSFAGMLKRASKEHSLLNREELVRKHKYFENDPEQLYIQVQLTNTLQKCYDQAKEIVITETTQHFENCAKNSKRSSSNEDDNEYIYQMQEQARRHHQTNSISLVMVSTTFKQFLNLMYNPLAESPKHLTVKTRQFLSRSVQQLTQKNVIKQQENIKAEFLSIISSTKLGPMMLRSQGKAEEIAIEVSKIVWKLVTASPPIILFSEINMQFYHSLHELCPSGSIAFDKARKIKDEEEQNMPQVLAYATPTVFRSNDGHVAFKAQVFV